MVFGSLFRPSISVMRPLMVPGPSQRASIIPKVALLSCCACETVAVSIVIAGKSLKYFFIVLVLVLKNPVLAGFYLKESYLACLNKASSTGSFTLILLKTIVPNGWLML